MKQYDILLDVGGTGIKGGFFSKNLAPVPQNFAALSDQSKDVIIKNFADICRRLWDSIAHEEKSVGNIKMAFPGPFDYKKGISELRGLSKYENLFGISIPHELISLGRKNGYDFIPKNLENFKFVNDVEAYALGAINKYKLNGGYRVLYLCIGTGAGSAYSVDGKIVNQGEKGVPQNGWIYPVRFKDSIIDEYISVRGIKRLAEQFCGKSFSPLELAQNAKNGDENAIAAYKEFGSNLNGAITPLLKEFGANTLVLGGNISRSSELFIPLIMDTCEKSEIEVIIDYNTSELAMLGLTRL